jgi:hypothetical protein
MNLFPAGLFSGFTILFFSIERKAFEAFHSHECDSFLSHLLSHRLRLAGM